MGRKQTKKKKAEAQIAEDKSVRETDTASVPPEGQLDELAATRHEESDLDDDDVPSELLPVNWRNPQLDVETEIVAPVSIVMLDSDRSDDPETQISQNPENYFETPFDPNSAADEPQDPSILTTLTTPPVEEATALPRREPLQYISAWDQDEDCVTPPVSDKEEDLHCAFEIASPSASASSAADRPIEDLGGLSIEQWVADALKGPPSSVPLPDSTQRSLPSWTLLSLSLPIKVSTPWLTCVAEKTSG
jgi:hypothetical protein